MKYLKKFDTLSEAEEYLEGNQAFFPNISFIKSNNTYVNGVDVTAMSSHFPNAAFVADL